MVHFKTIYILIAQFQKYLSSGVFLTQLVLTLHPHIKIE